MPRQSGSNRFCVHCGAQLPPPDAVPAPVYAPVYPPMMAPVPPPPKKRTGLWITLGVLGVLFVCGIITVVTNALVILDRGGTLF